MSPQTRSRIKRTALQVLAGGVLGGFASVALDADIKRALFIQTFTAASTVVAAWFQNVLEDVQAITDRRGDG